jgi:hypothetical protein
VREDVLDWILSSAPHKLRQLPELDDQIEALIDGCIERGLNSSALMCNGWQIVLKAGTLRLIESDVVPSGPPPPGATFSPPVFTPSRKHARSASAEDPLAMPSFTMSGMPGMPTMAHRFIVTHKGFAYLSHRRSRILCMTWQLIPNMYGLCVKKLKQ